MVIDIFPEPNNYFNSLILLIAFNCTQKIAYYKSFPQRGRFTMCNLCKRNYNYLAPWFYHPSDFHVLCKLTGTVPTHIFHICSTTLIRDKNTKESEMMLMTHRLAVFPLQFDTHMLSVSERPPRASERKTSFNLTAVTFQILQLKICGVFYI